MKNILSCGLQTSELYGNPELKTRWISQRGGAGLLAYLNLDEHAAVPQPDCVGFQLNRQPPSQIEWWQPPSLLQQHWIKQEKIREIGPEIRSRKC